MIINKHFWKNKTVLITGFEGFLGSNLTKALIRCGTKVVGLDIKTGRKGTILTTDDYRKMTVIKGSVTNYRLLEDVLTRKKINVVFHLAAEAIVGKCHQNPLRAFLANIKGTWNLLEAKFGKYIFDVAFRTEERDKLLKDAYDMTRQHFEGYILSLAE